MSETTIEKQPEVLNEDEKQLVEKPMRRRIFSPRVDIFEANEDVMLVAEMPGVDEEGIDITLEKRTLTIRGTASERELDGYKAAYLEHPIGDYERSFVLSEDVDRDNIQATIKNGLLTVVLPKAERAKLRKIAVKTS